MANWRYQLVSVSVGPSSVDRISSDGVSQVDRISAQLQLALSDNGRNGWGLVSIVPICSAQGKTEAFLAAFKSVILD
jgi:hypothetical protein